MKGPVFSKKIVEVTNSKNFAKKHSALCEWRYMYIDIQRRPPCTDSETNPRGFILLNVFCYVKQNNT